MKIITKNLIPPKMELNPWANKLLLEYQEQKKENE